MAQKEMTRITEERILEIISRIEMYGHGAGYTADEVLEIAQQMLALRQKEQHESNTCRLNFEPVAGTATRENRCGLRLCVH